MLGSVFTLSVDLIAWVITPVISEDLGSVICGSSYLCSLFRLVSISMIADECDVGLHLSDRGLMRQWSLFVDRGLMQCGFAVQLDRLPVCRMQLQRLALG